MAIATSPSKLTLPRNNPGVTTVVDYLISKFPQVSSDVWRRRAVDGKIHWHDGTCITTETLYQPQQRVYYYREVESEPVIPFNETVLFEDADLLVAFKPSFLPVTPGGCFVNECLQTRLRTSTGIEHLQALHRLDRVTAGLVMFSVNPETCHLYHQLFATRQVKKTYQALALISGEENTPLIGQQWQVINRLACADPRFLMTVIEGEPNSHSVVRCLDRFEDKALFELAPITGKTHQLRVHMQALGWPILNDRYYPTLQPERADDFERPLQLLAQKLDFIDPVSREARMFDSGYELTLSNGLRQKVSSLTGF